MLGLKPTDWGSTV
uniref:Uncharacterized protein n=1 Tax=Arundo donax TaxID=35708 RepID=A0A0A8ZCN0_ARUDO